MTKFKFAIITAPLVLTFSSSICVHAQLSSLAPITPASHVEDQLSNQMGNCYPDTEGENRQIPKAAITSGTNDQSRILKIKGLRDSCEAAMSFLKENERRARKELNGNVKNMFLSDTAEMENFVNRFTRVVAGVEFGAVVKIHNRATDPKKYKVELLAYQATKNTGQYAFANATVKEGVETVVVRMFPRTAPLLNEQVTTLASSTLLNITTFIDGSEFKADDPSRIIRDESGTFSIDERRQALYREWSSFDESGSTWDLHLLKRLVDETEIIYVQSVEAPRRKFRPIS